MTRDRWIGRALAAIGALHTALAVAVAHATFRAMLTAGLWDTLRGDPARERWFWFLTAGIALVLVGSVVDALERDGRPMPPVFAWGLLVLAVVGIVVAPRSGFWAVLLVALGAVVRTPRRGASGCGRRPRAGMLGRDGRSGAQRPSSRDSRAARRHRVRGW